MREASKKAARFVQNLSEGLHMQLVELARQAVHRSRRGFQGIRHFAKSLAQLRNAFHQNFLLLLRVFAQYINLLVKAADRLQHALLHFTTVNAQPPATIEILTNDATSRVHCLPRSLSQIGDLFHQSLQLHRCCIDSCLQSSALSLGLASSKAFHLLHQGFDNTSFFFVIRCKLQGI